MNYFSQILSRVIDQAVNPFLLFLFAIAIAIFLWGIFGFILNADNEDKRAEGKQHLIWGIIGLFIMFGVWGVIRIIQATIAAM